MVAEELQIFASFKFEKHAPPFRLHVWDLIQEANISTTSIYELFEDFYDRIEKTHREQGFMSDDGEVSETENGDLPHEFDIGNGETDDEFMEQIN